VEFGFLTQGDAPAECWRNDPNAEHQVLRDDRELSLRAHPTDRVRTPSAER